MSAEAPSYQALLETFREARRRHRQQQVDLRMLSESIRRELLRILTPGPGIDPLRDPVGPSYEPELGGWMLGFTFVLDDPDEHGSLRHEVVVALKAVPRDDAYLVGDDQGQRSFRLQWPTRQGDELHELCLYVVRALEVYLDRQSTEPYRGLWDMSALATEHVQER